MQSPRTAPKQGRGNLLFWGGVAALVVAAALVAVFVGRGDDDSGAGGTTAGDTTAAASVAVTGAALPELTEGGDGAVGQDAPGLAGSSVDGEPLTISAADGPRALLFLAHWCPHCQEEVPQLVDWLEAEGAPEGVELVAVATANDPDGGNYPPSAWLEREGWTIPTLLDDDASTAAQAYGVSGFPFYVFVNGDGEIAARGVGIGVEGFAQQLAAIAG